MSEQRYEDQLLGSAVLAEGTNANTFKTTAIVHYSIAGDMYTKAATDNIAFATAGDAFVAQADLTSCLYRVLINAAGTVVVRQGTAILTASIGPDTPLVPPAGKASHITLGFIRVDNSGGTFTPASTDLGAATVTDTYWNRQSMPQLNA